MIRPNRSISLTLLVGFAMSLTTIGCGDSQQAKSVESVTFDPSTVKSQEDSMKKAAEDAAKASK